MTRTCADSVTVASLPDGLPMYAAYVDGLYRNYDECKKRFPTSIVIGIAVFPSTLAGDCLDVEQGDATPVQAPEWVRARRNAGHGGPLVYCSLAAWPSVRSEFVRQGVPEPSYWIAAYPGNGPELYDGSVGHQWTDTGPYDLSVFVDYLPGIDPMPVPDQPTLTYPPQAIPGSTQMQVRFQTTTGSDGTAYVAIPMPPGCTVLLGGWADVSDPTIFNPPRHDGDIRGTFASGIVCQPTVGGSSSQRLRLAGGIPNHFYTGHAICG